MSITKICRYVYILFMFRPSLNSNELVKIGESEYIQSNASTPLPTIPILTSRQDFGTCLYNE